MRNTTTWMRALSYGRTSFGIAECLIGLGGFVTVSELIDLLSLQDPDEEVIVVDDDGGYDCTILEVVWSAAIKAVCIHVQPEDI